MVLHFLREDWNDAMSDNFSPARMTVEELKYHAEYLGHLEWLQAQAQMLADDPPEGGGILFAGTVDEFLDTLA